MKKRKLYGKSWKFIDEYRGKTFFGEWPTLREMYEMSLDRYPDNPVFTEILPEKVSYTYSEAYKIIKNVASFLIRDGVKKGEHVAVSGKNSIAWAIAYLAITFAGAVIVPLDYSLHVEDMEKLLKFGDVDRIFIDSEKIDQIDQNGEFLKKKYSLEKFKDDDERKSKYEYIFNMNGNECELPKVDSREIAAILFTSGTTGIPKGVMLTHNNLTYDTFTAQKLMSIYPSDIFYVILPIHHAYTMTAVFLETFMSGASCVFGKRLVTPLMLKELKEGKVTMLLGVPMLFNKLLKGLMDGVEKSGKSGLVHFLMSFFGFFKKHFNWKIGRKIFNKLLLNKISLENIRICICGGGPLPASTFKSFNQLGVDFVQGYGLTETSPIVHLNPVKAYNEESVGLPFFEMEQKIVDPDENGDGIIYIRGPQVMKGYYKNEEATKEVLSEDGWFNTGDVGHIDKKGYLYLTGRAKSVIVTEGGKNVFPEEIEDKFQLYSEIEQICIIPYVVDKALKAEGIRAVIYPASAYSINKNDEEVQKRMEEIVEEVNRNLQSYKKITKVTVSKEALPMTSTKKVKRFEVIKLYK